MSSHYTATVTREGRFWLIAIPELDELTQARRLGEAELMAREVIALHTDQALEDIDVTIDISRVGDIDDVSAKVTSIAEYRAKAAEAEAKAMTESRRLAKELADQGVPIRDIGELLHVSFQRAHQLIAEA